MERNELIAGLREMADFLETHPAVPAPHVTNRHVAGNVYLNDEDDEQELAAARKFLESVTALTYSIEADDDGDVRFDLEVGAARLCVMLNKRMAQKLGLKLHTTFTLSTAEPARA